MHKPEIWHVSESFDGRAETKTNTNRNRPRIAKPMGDPPSANARSPKRNCLALTWRSLSSGACGRGVNRSDTNQI